MSDEAEVASKNISRLSKDEIDLLKAARALEDLQKTEGWKCLRTFLESHIAQRERMLLQPLSAMRREDGQSMDSTERLASLECIKGAVIGLRLAISIPETILQEASDLRERLTAVAVNEGAKAS